MSGGIWQDGQYVLQSTIEERYANLVRENARMQARIGALEAREARLLALAGRVLLDFPDYAGLDGFECQDALLQAGLIEPVTITPEYLAECDPDRCSCRDYFGNESEMLGEHCNRVTELGKRARAALEAK